MNIEHETPEIRVYALGDGYRKASFFPKNVAGTSSFVNIPNRRISEIIVHHSAGGLYEGIRAVDELADYFTALPTYKRDENGQFVRDDDGELIKVGGGRGWPGIPYTFVVPGIPQVEDGRLVVYRIWSDSWRTWHTGGVHNSHGVGICVGGWYRSRREVLSEARDRPTDEAMAALNGLVDYLAQRYALPMKPGALLAHREAGGTACPGDALEAWVREKRGDSRLVVVPKTGPRDMRDLSTVRAVQEALVELGYDPGKVDGIMGPRTANGLRAFQRQAGVVPDGVFGPITEAALRRALYRPA